MNRAAVPIVIFGTGYRARTIWDLLCWCFAEQYEVVAYFDDFRKVGESGPGGAPIQGTFQDGIVWAAEKKCAALIASGTRQSHVRSQLLRQLQQAGVEIPALVPAVAHVSPSAKMGAGSVLMPGVYVGANARIGPLCCAYGGVVIEHDCTLGENVLLGPGAKVAGLCTLEDGVFLGTGALVLPGRRVGRSTLVGAGAVVTRDLPPAVVAVGSPARVRRRIRPDDEVPYFTPPGDTP
ncbi:MAG: carbonic anhydrase [Pirellulaceae bacterium]|nr:MAG: carbonic anhydrase [Pirellulaceae bacterium]